MKVYIASPYTIGDQIDNVRTQMTTFDEILELGFTPFAPLLVAFQHLLSPKSWEIWMQYDLQWLEMCDVLLRLPGESAGADIEVAHALEKGIKIVYSIEELKILKDANSSKP